MGRNFGLKAETIKIDTRPPSMWRLIGNALATASRRALFKVKVWLGWRYR